jgi:hypothetical protein
MLARIDHLTRLMSIPRVRTDLHWFTEGSTARVKNRQKTNERALTIISFATLICGD